MGGVLEGLRSGHDASPLRPRGGTQYDAQPTTLIYQSSKARRDRAVRPLDWVAYQRTYMCTHDRIPRYRSEGKRPRRSVRHTGCMFRFIVQICEIDGEWRLKVKLGTYLHNHPVDAPAFRT